MTGFKFNVGDKVIDLGFLVYIENPYHYKTHGNIEHRIFIVTAANKDLFTWRNNEIPSFMAGVDEGKYHRQSNGESYCWCSKTKVYHVEKDADFISAEIKRFTDKATKEIEKKESDEISRLEYRIAEIKLLDSPHRKALKHSSEALSQWREKVGGN